MECGGCSDLFHRLCEKVPKKVTDKPIIFVKTLKLMICSFVNRIKKLICSPPHPTPHDNKIFLFVCLPYVCAICLAKLLNRFLYM